MVGEEEKKTCTCFTQERLLTGGCGGCWSVQLLFGDERCTLKMHTMYVCCVRGGDGRDVSLCLHLPHLLLVLPPQRRLNKSGENTQGKKKKSNFFFSFHQQFMMERCSTYSPHRPPAPPSERWLHSIEASLLRCPQSRCRLKPRFPSTWELEIEGMIGSHLVISGFAGLTGRSLSCMCMTNEHNISKDTPRAV